MGGLVEIVRTARPDLEVSDVFGVTLEARIASARAAWREVDLDAERFAAHLAALLAPPVASLDQLHVEDLYLACASLEGLPAAIAAFDRTCSAGIDLALGAAGVGTSELARVRRHVRDRLLVAADGGPPRLASYAGKGSLGSWVRIHAMREAQRLFAQGALR